MLKRAGHSKWGSALSACLLAGLLSQAETVRSGELLPLTEFYDTPKSFTATGKPGDLIRSEEFGRYHLSSGVKATRILYGSMSSQGELVASSGVVLVPPGDAPEGGWPVIAWAHGTSGVNRRCAPSLMVEAFSVFQVPNIYTEQGYAVVATDYAGLGTDYPFDYLDGISNAWDVINSVKAARVALPDLGENWLAAGESAGAHAMQGVAQLEADIKDPSYLGIIAIGGLGDARTPMRVLSEMHPWLGIYISHSVSARYSDFDQADILKEQGNDILEQANTKCEGAAAGGLPNYTSLKGSEVFKVNWDLDSWVDKYFRADESMRENYRGPALVINAETEPPAILVNDLEAAKRMCHQGLRVHYELIADASHGNVTEVSVNRQLTWMADRFAGRSSPSNCDTLPK